MLNIMLKYKNFSQSIILFIYTSLHEQIKLTSERLFY